MGYIDKHHKQKKKTGFNQFTFDGNGYETTDIEETIFETANGHEHGDGESDNDYFTPFTLKIDADGDQTEELFLEFTPVDDTTIKVTLTYKHPQGGQSFESEEFMFSPPFGTKNFSIVHHEVTEGVYTYKLFLTEPDYRKVFYATDAQRAKSERNEQQMRQEYINNLNLQDTVIPEDMMPRDFSIILAQYIGINFNKKTDGTAEYSIGYYTRLNDTPALTKFTVQNHQYATIDTPIVRDLTDVREKDEAATDRKASSFTVPIEVGLGENTHKYEITFSEHQSNESMTGGAFGRAMEENGLAYIAIDGWRGVRKIPIPLPFKDLKAPIITDHATHMIIRFKGELYDTVLRVYQRHQVVPASEKGQDETPDEVFAIVVRVDPLPSNKNQVPEKSRTHFGKTIPYKTQFIDGKRKPYNTDYNYYTDESEFEQQATDDARANLSRQPTSSNKREELFNITLEETKAFGVVLKDKTFTDMLGMEVKGEELFYHYLSLVISVKKLEGIMRSPTQEPEHLLYIQNAIEQAQMFIVLADSLADSPLGPRPEKPKPRTNGNVLNTDHMRHHQPKVFTFKPKYDIRKLPEMIKNAEWLDVKGAMGAPHGLHSSMQNFVIKQKSAEITAYFEKLAREDISKYLDEEKKQNRYTKNLEKTERAQAEQIKDLRGSFNLDARYRHLIAEENPPENIQRVKALFYPEHLNVGQDIQEATAIDLPLYYYQKDGKWVVVSMANKQKNNFFFSPVTATVKAGETHPPYEMFTGLDHVDHLPKGLLFYEIPGGESRKVYMTSRTPWWKYAGYVALALFAIGLTVATFGGGAAAAAVATKVLFTAAGVVGAAGAAMTMYDESQTGQLTTKSVIVNTLDIVGAFIGVTKLATAAKLTKAANAAQKTELAGGLMGKLGMKALTGRHAYIALEMADLGVDTTMVLIGTADGIAQLHSILTGPGTWEERMRDAANIIPFLVLQGGLFLGTVPGRAKGINDAVKQKMIGALPTEGGSIKKPAESPIKQATTPFLYELNKKGVFDQTTLEAMVAKIDNPAGFDKAISLIKPEEIPLLKALSARFSEENVLYALYYNKGNITKAAEHLRANPKVFGDRGEDLEKKVFEYETLRHRSKTTSSKSIDSEVEYWKAEYEASKKKSEAVLEKRQQNSDKWRETKRQVSALKKEQTSTLEKLAEIKTNISEAQGKLLSYQYEAYFFEEFAKLKKLGNAQGYDDWLKVHQQRFAKSSEFHEELANKVAKKETDLAQRKESFQKEIGQKVDDFYVKIEDERKHLQEILRNDPENVAAHNGLKKLEDKIAEFHQKQEDDLLKYLKDVEYWEKWLVDAKERLAFRKQVVDGNESLKTAVKSHFEKQAEFKAKRLKLQGELTVLRTTRDELVKEVQDFENQIMNLRVQMAKQWKNSAGIRKEIQDLTNQKNDKQQVLVNEEAKIAQAEEKLYKIELEENAYNLDVKDKIDPTKMTQANYGNLLDQNIVSRDVVQMKQLAGAQGQVVVDLKKQLTTTTGLQQNAFEHVKKLNKAKKELFKQQDEVMAALNGSGADRSLSKAELKKRLQEIREGIQQLEKEIPNARRSARELYQQKQQLKRKLGQEESKQQLYEQFYTHKANVEKQQGIVTNHKEQYANSSKSLAVTDEKMKATDKKMEELYKKQQKEYDEQITAAANEMEMYKTKRKDAEKLKIDFDQLKNNAQEAAKLADLHQQQKATKNKWQRCMQMVTYLFHELPVKTIADNTLKQPALKALWKVNKILLKIRRPKHGAKDNISEGAIEDSKALEALLGKYLSDADKNVGTLPDDPEKLWKELFDTLENPQWYGYYPSGMREKLMDTFEEMYTLSQAIATLNGQILIQTKQLSQLPDEQLTDKFKLTEDEQKLLESNGVISERQRKRLLKYLESLEKTED